MSYSDKDITSLLDDLHSIGHYETPAEEVERVAREFSEYHRRKGIGLVSSGSPLLILFLLDHNIPHTYVLVTNPHNNYINLLPVIRGHYIRNNYEMGPVSEACKGSPVRQSLFFRDLKEVKSHLEGLASVENQKPFPNSMGSINRYDSLFRRPKPQDPAASESIPPLQPL